MNFVVTVLPETWTTWRKGSFAFFAMLRLCNSFFQDKSKNGTIFTLVFLCSQSTSVPHQIGLKQFRSSSMTEETGAAPDHRVELHGHVVGIALDRSGQYIFANVRR